MYNTGKDFWDDLVKQFGEEQAFVVARNYLEIPIMGIGNLKSEVAFREELEEAMAEAAEKL